MRFLSLVCLCLTVCVADAQEFTNAEAKAAKEQYEKDLDAARKKYADSLEEAAKKALEKDQLDEAIKIKKVVGDLRTAKNAPASKKTNKKVLWKHKGGYFERLNDGYWVERVPNGVAHIFAQGQITNQYVEISRTTASKTIVRLYNDHCTYLRKGRRKFEPLYKGRWVDRD
jgi:hypothetical protein